MNIKLAPPPPPAEHLVTITMTQAEARELFQQLSPLLTQHLHYYAQNVDKAMRLLTGLSDVIHA